MPSLARPTTTSNAALASDGPYPLVVSGLAATNYADAKVTNAVNYYYVVSAVGAGAESSNSLPATAAPLPSRRRRISSCKSPAASCSFRGRRITSAGGCKSRRTFGQRPGHELVHRARFDQRPGDQHRHQPHERQRVSPHGLSVKPLGNRPSSVSRRLEMDHGRKSHFLCRPEM